MRQSSYHESSPEANYLLILRQPARARWEAAGQSIHFAKKSSSALSRLRITSMKVVCFANNFVGLKTVEHLRRSGAEIVALVTHDPAESKRGEEIIEAAAVAPENRIVARCLGDPATLEQISALKPDCGVSAFFGYLLRKPLIDLFPCGIVNLHSSLLPLNRGSWPNVWTIIDQTPAGVTMHLVDEGVDSGAILAQRDVEVLPTDSGRTLNDRLAAAAVELFKDHWKAFADGKLKPRLQDDSLATLHRVKDAAAIDCIDLDADYRGGDLINILRARTFPPHRGAWFEIDGERYFLELKIEKE